MSGGHFNYKQDGIREIADEIEDELNNQGKEIPDDELFCYGDYYEKYTEEKYYSTYSETAQEKMREAIKQLRLAYIYAKRVDWFLSGDDGEKNFIKRLEEELNE